MQFACNGIGVLLLQRHLQIALSAVRVLLIELCAQELPLLLQRGFHGLLLLLQRLQRFLVLLVLTIEPVELAVGFANGFFALLELVGRFAMSRLRAVELLLQRFNTLLQVTKRGLGFFRLAGRPRAGAPCQA